MPGYQKLEPRDFSQETFWLREKLWFDNFAQNLPAIREGKNAILLKDSCAGPCVVVGAGPSVEQFKLLEQLKGATCHIISSDRMLIPLLKEEIVPEYVVSTDGDPKIAEFYEDESVRKYARQINLLLAGQVHPSVVKVGSEIFRDVYWFNVLMDDPEAKMSISRVIYWMSNEMTMAQSYGNVGSFAWAFAEFLGHKVIMLVGVDFSYGESVQPMQTLYWKGFLERRKGKVQEVLKNDYRWENNPFGHRILTDALWDSYLKVLQHGIEASQAKTVNCSPLTTIHGPKVICMSLEAALQKYTVRIR